MRFLSIVGLVVLAARPALTSDVQGSDAPTELHDEKKSATDEAKYCPSNAGAPVRKLRAATVRFVVRLTAQAAPPRAARRLQRLREQA